MGLVPDQGAVQELAAASPDPAFGDRIHAGRPHVAQHGPDAGVSQDRAGRGGEVRSAIADHELDPMCLFAGVHQEVAGLLGGPRLGGMGSGPRMRARLLACPITARTWAWVPPGRPVLKKSHARIAPA